MGIFQVPSCNCLYLWTVIAIGSDTSLDSTFLISWWLLVASCCQRHLILSSNVIEINKSVLDVDVGHLVKSPKVLVHVPKKIVQALVFRLSSTLEKIRVSERLASSSVRTVQGKIIVLSRFSTTLNLTCR